MNKIKPQNPTKKKKTLYITINISAFSGKKCHVNSIYTQKIHKYMSYNK